jgi:hypothetical protein
MARASRRKLAREDLERHGAVERELPRLVDGPRGAASEAALEAVAAQRQPQERVALAGLDAEGHAADLQPVALGKAQPARRRAVHPHGGVRIADDEDDAARPAPALRGPALEVAVHLANRRPVEPHMAGGIGPDLHHPLGGEIEGLLPAPGGRKDDAERLRPHEVTAPSSGIPVGDGL